MEELLCTPKVIALRRGVNRDVGAWKTENRPRTRIPNRDCPRAILSNQRQSQVRMVRGGSVRSKKEA
ncbi:UNVERIFIED_CONTAM: hypothetical protein Sradi_1740300 [Sesamum radiatum]|uniref:Uncharacterized protein n=1 Tax=Sesamum radiatum TaxID=300843 RepID=A0AAW2TU61_SESRA